MKMTQKFWVMLYVLRRIWRVKARLFVISFFLALGFFGWLAGESTKSSIQASVVANAKQVLSADITVSARRELSETELSSLSEVLKGKGQWIKSYEFFGMMTKKDDTRLVLVKVIPDEYPYYGKLLLEAPGASAKDMREQRLWAYQEFKNLSGLQINDRVKLGEAEFTVSNFINEDKTQTFRLASLAPRVFIHQTDLEKTNLIQMGSTFTATYFFKANDDSTVRDLTETLKQKIPDPSVDITSFESLPEDESSPTQRLADFLGLTSLVALLFSALSLFYLLQVWSLEQQRERAFLFASGATNTQLFSIELLQSVLVSFLSTTLSVIFLLILKPLLESVLTSAMKSNFQLLFTSREIFLVLLSQFALLTLMSAPWKKLSHISILQLLKNNFSTQQAGLTRLLPLFLLLWPFSIIASQSLRNGTYFFLSLVFVALSLVFFGRGFLSLIAVVKWKSWKFSVSAKSLSRQSTATWAFLFTVGLSAALLNLVPQIQGSVENLLSFDEMSSRPSLFLFDIQSEQWPEMDIFLKERNIQPTAVSPMVRARILKINDEQYERKELTGFKSREEEESARSRNRGINMTYRSYLQTGEKIIRGKEINGPYQEGSQQLPLLSIEKRYAGRMGLKIDDVVTFDIQGIEVKGQVANLREVKWSRFEPNFFIVMQDGVLNEAPQTRLATLPYTEPDARTNLTKDLAQKFSNVSVIDVERLMETLIQNMNRVSGALRLMTTLTLLTGLLTLIFLLTAESERRGFEVHLKHVLGASNEAIVANRLIEVTALGLTAVSVGVVSSFAISFFIVDQIFQVSFVPQIVPAFIIFLAVLTVCGLVTYINTRRQLRANSFLALKRDE